MNRSTDIRRLATLAVTAGAMALLVPLAQAGNDPDRIADSVDTARAGQVLSQPGYDSNRIADSVDTARAVMERSELVSQPGYDPNRIADSVDTAHAAMLRAKRN